MSGQQRHTGNSSPLPAKCRSLLHVIRGGLISARFSQFAFVLFCFAILYNKSLGEFCFPLILMYPSTSSRETLRFSGNKIHCCSRDQPLSVNVPVNSKTAHAPTGQTPGHLTFLKNFGQIPRYVASLDGQMPHPLELQRGSNPLRLQACEANCGNKFCKIFSHYEFLVQLVFGPHFKQRHIPR